VVCQYESSKQNYYIISFWVIIKAIFTSRQTWSGFRRQGIDWHCPVFSNTQGGLHEPHFEYLFNAARDVVCSSRCVLQFEIQPSTVPHIWRMNIELMPLLKETNRDDNLWVNNITIIHLKEFQFNNHISGNAILTVFVFCCKICSCSLARVQSICGRAARCWDGRAHEEIYKHTTGT